MKLTTPQKRELQKVHATGADGFYQGSGPNWCVRDRLRQMGLLELRDTPEQRSADGEHLIRRRQMRWYITDAGVSAFVTDYNRQTIARTEAATR